MKNSVSVSIIMGVYNPRNPVRFLRAVHSIIEQSLTDWELLLCDDGSDAAHTAVIRRAARLDSPYPYSAHRREPGTGLCAQ